MAFAKREIMNGIQQIGLSHSVIPEKTIYFDTPDSQLINNGQDMCVLQGNYDYEGREEEIFCAIRRRQRKQFKRNKKEYDKLSEHIGLFYYIVSTHADKACPAAK